MCLSVHYPEAKRIVIDDHSTVGDDAGSSRNYLGINSEFTSGSGEILPFFYFHKHGIEWGVRGVMGWNRNPPGYKHWCIAQRTMPIFVLDHTN